MISRKDFSPFPIHAAMAALFVFATQPIAAEESEGSVKYHPISIAGQIDVGQIVKGETGWHESGSLNGVRFNGDFVQRTGVWVTQEAIVNDKLSLKMGVGGLFWYALPTGTDPNTKLTQFGPGISQAQATYAFGAAEHPAAVLQMGFFPYKYNADAKDLGEYLLRSGAYPNYVVTGGWNMLTSAQYMMEGFRLNFALLDGRFQSDVLLAMEHDIPPMFDLSPTYVATYKPFKGLEIGAGADCNHCIPIKPSKESPHVAENRVITNVTVDSTGNYAFAVDSNSYYTFQGIKLMGRLSLDPKALLDLSFLGPEDLKLYSEIAVLGIKDYGYFYDDVFRRMPMLFGFNLPACKLLDVLSVEMEYYNTKFPTSIYQPVANLLPLIDFPAAPGDEAYNRANRDDWKWCVYAKKEIVQGMQLYAQIANDHIRTIAYNNGPAPANVPITNRNGKDWYYIVRLQFGI